MPTETQTLQKLTRNYRKAEQQLADARAQLDTQIQELKRAGWGFRELAAETGLAQGTIQNIIAQDPQAPQYWRKRCTRKPKEGAYCDEVWLKNTAAWCENCTRGLEIEISQAAHSS